MKLRRMIVVAGFTLASGVTHAAVNLINTDSTVGGASQGRVNPPDGVQSTTAPLPRVGMPVQEPAVPKIRKVAPPLPQANQGQAASAGHSSAVARKAPPSAARQSLATSKPAPSTKSTPIADSSPVVSTPLASTWTARQGETLRQALKRWSDEASFRLVWDTKVNYSIVAALSFHGSYIQSATDVIKAYEGAEKPLVIDFYPDQNLTLVRERNSK